MNAVARDLFLHGRTVRKRLGGSRSSSGRTSRTRTSGLALQLALIGRETLQQLA